MNFLFPDPYDYENFRKALESARYTDSGVLETLKSKDFPSVRESDVPLLLRCTERGTLLDTLIRLFLIEVPCDAESVQRAVRPLKLDTLVHAGLVSIDGAFVKANVKILPFKGFLVAFDSPRVIWMEKQKHYVMGIGSSTLTLANLTVRKHSRSTLDLGTGCGIHAFLAARHSHRVLAVDLNPRAVQLATFNAELNGLSNVKCLEGDFFEPVQGLKFDLIITNPPFVISPENTYIYRDGGMQADQICQKIVQNAPQFLNEGGYCQILCNWTEQSGQDWPERLRGWFEGTGCDVWVLRSENRDAATYASTWIRHTEKDEPEQFAQRFDQWMNYYGQHDIQSISAGLITMRRSGSHKNWYRADEVPEKMLGPCGAHIVQGFEMRDFLESLQDDKQLLNTRFRVSPDVRLERRARPSVEGWADESIQLRLTKGFAYSGNIDPYMANVIIGCNGRKWLKDLLAELVDTLRVDSAKITPTFCGIVRGLIERGFLVPHNDEVEK